MEAILMVAVVSSLPDDAVFVTENGLLTREKNLDLGLINDNRLLKLLQTVEDSREKSYIPYQ